MDRSLKRRRTALRFESLNSIDVPRRFLKIDMALDLLGEQLRPDDWGYARKFASLPFSYQTGTYLWHQFEVNEGRWHLTYEAIPVAKEDRGTFFALKLIVDV
ncbi:hypothetical protein U0C82_18385 [Fulvimarina sp. 2208YS6-2-32]|uniref:Uncharacterized protein n=1 Tax=Fulvimarina uroteuthidis TaxID=3098149 RepID=A0ABU5I6T5_9HYPH|nr:hypothetical protein [Fulvimarina sp. 2208YS6-2-32]MDY8111094.1 hypothetical protein [Fulvimarina sp. 2208YS6-2-32]